MHKLSFIHFHFNINIVLQVICSACEYLELLHARNWNFNLANIFLSCPKRRNSNLINLKISLQHSRRWKNDSSSRLQIMARKKNRRHWWTRCCDKYQFFHSHRYVEAKLWSMKTEIFDIAYYLSTLKCSRNERNSPFGYVWCVQDESHASARNITLVRPVSRMWSHYKRSSSFDLLNWCCLLKTISKTKLEL